MAPDPAAAKAGQGQAVPVRWPTLGHDEQAAWGECQGSGAAPYRCQAALADGAARCSCPSRKLPCKHAIGLLLLLADGQVPAAACPDWVAEWLANRASRASRASRADRADRQAGKAAQPTPADPQAQQRRAASREKKVDAGVEELRRWLGDLARGGLAAAARGWSAVTAISVRFRRQKGSAAPLPGSPPTDRRAGQAGHRVRG